MTSGIYGIYDSYNGDCLYIGQSGNIEYRWKQHIRNLNNGKHKRKDFIRWFVNHANDPHAMEFKILRVCKNSEEEKNFYEAQWFFIMKPRFYGKLPSKKDSFRPTYKTRIAISNGVRKQLRNRQTICNYCGRLFIPKYLIEIVCTKCRKRYIYLVKYVSNYLLKNKSKIRTNSIVNKNKIADNVKHLIINEYLSGKSLRELAHKYNVSHTSIRKLLVKNNVIMHKSGFASQRKLKAISDKKRNSYQYYKCIVCNKRFLCYSFRHRKTCSKSCLSSLRRSARKMVP
jgi:hypothetical protein